MGRQISGQILFNSQFRGGDRQTFPLTPTTYPYHPTPTQCFRLLCPLLSTAPTARLPAGSWHGWLSRQHGMALWLCLLLLSLSQAVAVRTFAALSSAGLLPLLCLALSAWQHKQQQQHVSSLSHPTYRSGNLPSHTTYPSFAYLPLPSPFSLLATATPFPTWEFGLLGLLLPATATACLCCLAKTTMMMKCVPFLRQ